MFYFYFYFILFFIFYFILFSLFFFHMNHKGWPRNYLWPHCHATYRLIKSPRSPVILSHRMREVIMLPEQENNRSKSGWAICLGNPDTYRLAPFIASLLGWA